MDIIIKAKEFASHLHRDHIRNDKEKTPYVLHLAEVAELVTQSGGSDPEIAAAWLHDTVEDTETTIKELRKEFGDEIADIVEGVTDLPEWLALSMHERKAKQAVRVASERSDFKCKNCGQGYS
jgi:(p)ppGpp synthase/HD superfamily hydrolase